MDAFELLKADHQKVAELFDRLEAASGKAKLNVFEQIKSELELHAEVEETIFYPALEKPEETHDLTLEAYEEHKVVKTLLAELAGARSATDEWQAQVKVLRENVEHHVDEEENELFDKASDALSDEEIESLGERMEAAKAKKQGRSVPKRSTARAAGSSKSAKSAKSAGSKSIISKIADFVGIGSGTAKKKGGAASRKGAKKSSAKKSAKKSAAARGTKPSVRTSSKKGAKTSATRKRSSTSSKKRTATGAGNKAAKRRARGQGRNP